MKIHIMVFERLIESFHEYDFSCLFVFYYFKCVDIIIFLSLFLPLSHYFKNKTNLYNIICNMIRILIRLDFYNLHLYNSFKEYIYFVVCIFIVLFISNFS